MTLGLQERIDKFMQVYLSGDQPKLDDLGRAHFRSLVSDLGYQEIPGNLFIRAREKSIDTLMGNDPIHRTRGESILSYVSLDGPGELIKFTEEYQKLWEKNGYRTDYRRSTTCFGFVGALIGGLADCCLGAIANEAQKSNAGASGIVGESSALAIGVYIAIPIISGLMGGLMAYRLSHSKYQQEEEIIQGFVDKYTSRIVRGNEAYKKALVVPEESK